MNQSTVAELIRKSMDASDMQAFRQLVEMHQDGVYRLAFRLLGDEAEAEDVTQECFIRLWQNLTRIDVERGLTAWLCKVASRLCLDRMKSVHYRTTQLSDGGLFVWCVSDEDPHQALTDKEFRQWVHLLAETLSPMQRLVFTLRCIEDRDVEEVAEITGLSAKKIKSNLYQARQVLMKKLKNYHQ